MLTWKELQKQAAKIVANTPQGEFVDKSFTAGSGGAPSNDVAVPEVHRSNTFQYTTVRHGPAHSGEVVVRCRTTNAMDRNGRKIYEAENGTVFVYQYQKGSPEDFDYGRLVSPNL